MAWRSSIVLRLVSSAPSAFVRCLCVRLCGGGAAGCHVASGDSAPTGLVPWGARYPGRRGSPSARRLPWAILLRPYRPEQHEGGCSSESVRCQVEEPRPGGLLPSASCRVTTSSSVLSVPLWLTPSAQSAQSADDAGDWMLDARYWMLDARSAASRGFLGSLAAILLSASSACLRCLCVRLFSSSVLSVSPWLMPSAQSADDALQCRLPTLAAAEGRGGRASGSEP